MDRLSRPKASDIPHEVIRVSGLPFWQRVYLYAVVRTFRMQNRAGRGR